MQLVSLPLQATTGCVSRTPESTVSTSTEILPRSVATTIVISATSDVHPRSLSYLSRSIDTDFKMWSSLFKTKIAHLYEVTTTFKLSSTSLSLSFSCRSFTPSFSLLTLLSLPFTVPSLVQMLGDDAWLRSETAHGQLPVSSIVLDISSPVPVSPLADSQSPNFSGRIGTPAPTDVHIPHKHI
jgi:hypothetical protein